MTERDNNLERYWDAVVKAIARKKAGFFHFPSDACFTGWCQEGGVGPTSSFAHSCNWEGIRDLAATFWKAGADVGDDDEWKQLSRRSGFYPEDLLEILLGVFIGGEGEPRPMNTISRDAIDDAISELNFGYRPSIHMPDTKGTP